MLTSAFAPLRIAAPRTLGVRAFGGYAQPPLTQGPGGKPGELATDEEQATGRTRLELEAFKKGHDYFNRQPVQMQKGQGTFENPVLVPSELDERIVGVVPLGQDGPIWFNIWKGDIYYVEELDLHFKLYNPLE